MIKDKQKALVVCTCNVNRSKTVAKFFKKHMTYMEVKDAGILCGFPLVVNQKLLDWADVVYCMDLEQQYYIIKKYPRHPKIFVMGISDIYNPDDDRLIEILNWYYGKGD